MAAPTVELAIILARLLVTAVLVALAWASGNQELTGVVVGVVAGYWLRGAQEDGPAVAAAMVKYNHPGGRR